MPDEKDETNEVTPKSIAEWMVGLLQNRYSLQQQQVAFTIRTKFGEQFVYRNKQRNWAINKDILDEFRKLTPDNIVWSRSRQDGVSDDRVTRQRREWLDELSTGTVKEYPYEFLKKHTEFF